MLSSEQTVDPELARSWTPLQSLVNGALRPIGLDQTASTVPATEQVLSICPVSINGKHLAAYCMAKYGNSMHYIDPTKR